MAVCGYLRISSLQDDSPCGFIYLAFGSNEGPGKACQDCVMNLKQALKLCSEELPTLGRHRTFCTFASSQGNLHRGTVERRQHEFLELLGQFPHRSQAIVIAENRSALGPCLAVQLHVIFQSLRASKQLQSGVLERSAGVPHPPAAMHAFAACPVMETACLHGNRETARRRAFNRLTITSQVGVTTVSVSPANSARRMSSKSLSMRLVHSIFASC